MAKYQKLKYINNNLNGSNQCIKKVNDGSNIGAFFGKEWRYFSWDIRLWGLGFTFYIKEEWKYS